MQLIEKYLKGFGKYQAYVYGLLFLPFFLSGAETLVFTFTGAVPKSRCCLPRVENCSRLDSVEYATEEFANASSRWYPLPKLDNLCAYCPDADADWNCTEESARPNCDDGIVFDHSEFQTSLATDFSMVCQPGAVYFELAKSLFMVGVLIGAGLFGALSDKYGRRPVFIGCALAQIVTFHLVLAAGFNMIAFFVFQIINGAVQYGTYLTGFIIIMELINGFPRTVCGVGVQAIFALGYVYVGVVATFVHTWRWVQFSVSILSLLYIPLFWLLPESIRWQVMNKKEDEARKTVLKAARMNGVQIPEQVLDQDLKVEEVEQATVLDLFKHATLAKNTLIVFFTWFVASMTYYGLSLNTSDLPGDKYVNFILSGLVEFPGYVICVPMMDKLGRRPTLVILFGIGGVCCIVSGFIPKPALSWLVVTFAAVGKACVSGAFAVIYNYSAELFPTVVRNAGTGFSSLCARIGSICAPQIHLLAHFGVGWLPIVIYGSFAIAAAILDLFLPETRNRIMPDTIEDGIFFSDPNYQEKIMNARNERQRNFEETKY